MAPASTTSPKCFHPNRVAGCPKIELKLIDSSHGEIFGAFYFAYLQKQTDVSCRRQQFVAKLARAHILIQQRRLA